MPFCHLLWQQNSSRHIERLPADATAAYNVIHCCLVPTGARHFSVEHIFTCKSHYAEGTQDYVLTQDCELSKRSSAYSFIATSKEMTSENIYNRVSFYDGITFSNIWF